MVSLDKKMLALALALAAKHYGPAPTKDCATCRWRHDKHGGHCYMFEIEPTGNVCGQYEKDPTP
jgi:hypothetical protein